MKNLVKHFFHILLDAAKIVYIFCQPQTDDLTNVKTMVDNGLQCNKVLSSTNMHIAEIKKTSMHKEKQLNHFYSYLNLLFVKSSNQWNIFLYVII